jgi:putative transposase
MPQKKLDLSCIYYIFNRGNNRAIIFAEDQNFIYYLDLFRRYLFPIVELCVYYMLANHFHMLIRVKDYEEFPLGKDPADHLSISLSKFFRHIEKLLIRPILEQVIYLKGASKEKNSQPFPILSNDFYIHQYPQKHGLVTDFRNWPYSSYGSYLRGDHDDLLFEKIMEDKDL